jgi:translocation and assembly module TamB
MSDGGERDDANREETPHEAQRLSASRLLLIVALFLVLAVYSIWSSDRFQTLMLGVSEQRLSELLQRPVHFDRVQFRVFPPSITLADVRIENDPRIPDEPLLSAAELTIGGGVSLSGAELRFGRVRAVSPRLSLTQFPDGTWNLPPGLTGAAEKKGGGLAVRVGELVIQRGLFELEGRQMGLDARLEDFALELTAQRPNRYTGTLVSQKTTLTLPGAEPLHFGLDVSFRLDPKRGASVDRLRAVGEFGDLQASGGLESAGGQDPTTLLLVSGELHIAEVERIFRAKLGFAGDARIRSEIRIPPSGGFRIAGQLSSPKVEAQGFTIEDLEATVSARPEVLIAEISRARYAGGTATGLFRIQDLAGSPAGSARPMTLALEARNLSLERFFADIQLPGTGLSGGAALSIALRWGEGGLERASGGGTLEIQAGPASSIVRGRYGIPTGGGGTLSVVDGRIGFDGTTFRFPASSIEMTGGLRIGQWTPDFDFSIRSRDLVEIDRLFQNFTAASGGRPEPLGLGGSGEADGHISKSWGNPEVSARISAENASYAGVVFGSVRGTAGMHDGAFLFQPLRVYEGSATLSLEGTVRYRRDPNRPTFDVTVTAKDYPVARLLDYLDLDYPIRGQISGEFPLSGSPPDAVSGSGVMVLADAEVWGQKFPLVTGRATLEPGRFELDELRASLNGGTLGGRGAVGYRDKTFEVRLAGDAVPIEDLEMVRDASGGLTGKLTFQITGSGEIDRPDLAISAALSDGVFHGKPLPPELSPHLEARLTRGVLSGTLMAPGRWTLSGSGEPFASPGKVEVELDAPDLSAFLGLTPLELPAGVGGALRAAGRFTWPERSGDPVSGQIEILEARLDAPDRPGLLRTSGPAKVTIENRRVTLEGLRAVGEGIDLTLRGMLDTGADPRTIQGRISGQAQATILELLRPGVGASGQLTFDVAAGGTVDKPELNGSVRIADGRYRAFGYSFDDIEGTLRLVGNSAELEGLRARVADGEAFAAGTFRLDGGKVSSYRVALQGRRVSVRAIPSLRLIVDADLVASGDLEDREIRGEITLLRGTYTKDVDVTVSDMLSRSRPGAALAAREPWKERTTLDIRIVSAASLEVRNNVARLSGTVDLTARGTLAEPVLLGQILLDEGGRVVFSDVRYEIEYGAITFSSTTRIAPFIDLRARAEIKAYDLTVSLVGTWPRVTPTFISDPPLSNDQILGLVLSGTPPDTRREDRTTDQLVSAAGGIVTGAVTGGLTRGTRQLFKLDRFQIDPVFQGSNLTTFRTTIGKQITQDLVVTSSIALDSSKEPIIRIEWQVTDTIFIQLIRDEDGNYSVTFRKRQRL